MAGERLTGINQGTLLAERILGNGDVLRAMIAGGRDKKVILQQVVSELGNDPVGQAGFLRTLFRNMAKEGTLKVTDRRDTALAILTDSPDEDPRLTQAMTPLVEANPTVVHDAYIEAVRQQTRENDPFSGSVAALLAVGKAIAPYLSQDPQRRQQIIDAWERTEDQFATATLGERFHIRSKIEDIKQGMFASRLLKTGEITPAQRGRTNRTLKFDAQVKQLRGKGLDNSTIAQRLGVAESTVKSAVSRLLKTGEITPAQRRRTSRTLEFDAQVRQLRGKGLDNSTIAQRLGVAKFKVEQVVGRLLKAGEITPQKRGRRYSS